MEDKLNTYLKRLFHHRIVSIYCEFYKNKTTPKDCVWISDGIIDHKLVYWALRNVCALTDYKMNNFTINRNSIIFNKEIYN